MKKNLMSVLILALLIVNIVLTVITMISVTSTNKKTAAVVNSSESGTEYKWSGYGGKRGIH